MSTFLGVANVQEKSSDSGEFKSTSFTLHKDRFNSLEATNGKVPVYLLKNDSTGKHEVHSEIPTGRKPDLESSLYLEKSKISGLPVNNQGYVSHLYVSQKQNPEEGKPNLSVYTLNSAAEKEYIGNGYEAKKLENSVKFTRISDGDRNESKLYNVRLTGSDIESSNSDSFGNIRVNINREEGDKHSVNIGGKVQKETDAVLVLNKEKLQGISKENDGAIRLIARDKRPEKIGKDKADIVVYENKFRKGDETLSKDQQKEKFGDLNFVGAGYTNNPKLLKLDKGEVTKEGLLKAIEGNNPIRTYAIINKNRALVGKEHMDAVSKGIAENPKFAKGIETAVSSAIKKNEEGIKSGEQKSNSESVKKSSRVKNI